MFFFPEYKFKAAIKELSYHPDESEARRALQEFNYQSRRFLGLNYFLSFIPDTQAYDARLDFNDAIETLVDDARDSLKENDFFDSLSVRAKLHGPIAHLLLLGPIWDILQFSADRVHSYAIFHNRYSSVSRLLKTLPVVNDLNDSHPLENLLHSLLNPVRLLTQLTTFTWLLINRILEIPTFSPESHFLAATLKGVNGLVFALAALPLKALEAICDIPYQILKNVVFNPLKFIGNSIVQAFKPIESELPQYQYSDNINNSSTNQISSTLGFNPQVNNQHHLYDRDNYSPDESKYDEDMSPGEDYINNNNNNYDSNNINSFRL